MALAHTLGFPRIGADRELNDLEADWKGTLGWERLFDEIDEAHAQGHRVKPAVIGPLTYLWQGKANDGDIDKLDLLERLLPVYGDVLNRLKAQGVEWVQIDEPILTLDLPLAWRSAFERAYHILQYSPLKKLVATCFNGLDDNLGLAVSLPVDGLHIDAVPAPDQLGRVLDRLPTYKILSVGLVNDRDAWRCEFEQALAQLRPAQERFGDNLWVSVANGLEPSPAYGFTQPLGNLHQTVTQLWQRA
ncbi:5-methyltetrahydropteroyltriglutamate-homocysteine methyltransferase [Pseudomonas sp. E102]